MTHRFIICVMALLITGCSHHHPERRGLDVGRRACERAMDGLALDECASCADAAVEAMAAVPDVAQATAVSCPQTRYRRAHRLTRVEYQDGEVWILDPAPGWVSAYPEPQGGPCVRYYSRPPARAPRPWWLGP